jgi:ferritin-like protein
MHFAEHYYVILNFAVKGTDEQASLDIIDTARGQCFYFSGPFV